MKNGYPEKHELNLIKNWNVKDSFGLINYIHERWNWKNLVTSKWEKQGFDKRPVFVVKFITGGWSGNEDLIDALLENDIFETMWYDQWQRGGKFTFVINPTQIGYKKASELAIELGITRQWIHRDNKFESIQISKGSKLFRLKA